MDFNFNRETEGILTVEEIIALELTNDLGEPILAHVCHILISEFRKFMFLIGENFLEGWIQYNDTTPNRDIVKWDWHKTLKSLVAPPVIDLVWVSLIKQHDVYSNFWDQIFGHYVDRNFPTGTEENEYCSYNTTLEMLEKYSDMISPFHNLWPKYNASWHFNDYFGFKYVNIQLLNKFTNYIQDNNPADEDGKITKNRVKKLSVNLLNKYTITSSGQRLFQTTTTSEKLLNQIVDQVIKLTPLTVKLQAKLMLDEESATSYIIEYWKFVLMTINDPK